MKSSAKPGRKVPGGVSSAVYIITVAAFITLFYALNKTEGTKPEPAVATPELPSYKMIRQEGYELIRPVLFTESSMPDEKLSDLNTQLKEYISGKKAAGYAEEVSVYLKKLSSVYSVSINEEEQYLPGSLMKVPAMLAWLKKAENDTTILSQKLFLKQHFNTGKKLHLSEEPLTEGKSYTISELLYYMICESSNDAVGLLLTNIEFKELQQVFADLSLPQPADPFAALTTDVSGYARFFHVLFNATYLNRQFSQYALSLLLKTDFREGLTRNIPDSIKVAHKYGESGNAMQQQLHEAGIFYTDNEPYLLVVMSRGNDFKKLSEILGEISQKVLKDSKRI
jgi:beta-lactamase class A